MSVAQCKLAIHFSLKMVFYGLCSYTNRFDNTVYFIDCILDLYTVWLVMMT